MGKCILSNYRTLEHSRSQSISTFSGFSLGALTMPLELHVSLPPMHETGFFHNTNLHKGQLVKVNDYRD